MAQSSVLTNSASGYVRIVLHLMLGMISFRMLCSALSNEELGFYGLVWSLLGYGVLFDLGMGVTIQKRTAELTQRKDWVELSRILSSVLFCNCVCAAVIVSVGWLGTDLFLRAIDVSAANHQHFRWALRIFVVGMAAMFPLEMFREVHYGQQRIAFAMHATTASLVVSFALLYTALHFHYKLPVILGVQVVCIIATGVILVVSALRVMPEVRLRVRYVSWTVIRSIARFSTVVYISVVAGIVMLQMDRLMVSAILSVSAVAIYHIGAKVSEIFASFTRQLPESLAPAAAALHGAGDRVRWQKLFLRGVRLNALITTPLFLLCALFLEGLLALLTRNHTQNSETIILGLVLLLWSYSTNLTHGVSKAVLLMSGRESRLVRLLIVEAFLNLASSFALLQWLESPVGAALGSLVPALVIGWGFMWPWTAREIGMRSVQLVRHVLFPPLLASLPLVAFAIACRFVPALDYRTSTIVFFIDSAVAGSLALMGTWHLALHAEERRMFRTKIKAMMARRARKSSIEPRTERDELELDGSGRSSSSDENFR